MQYQESAQDKKLRKWFQTDNTRQLLKRIVLEEGCFRSLNELDITFQFPIAVIAGKNGSGKSTVLALTCCAFHNKKGGFKPRGRKTSYYTFSDFFIQHSEEVSPSGIAIRYDISHDKWRKTDINTDPVGTKTQYRRKKPGGKWNDYDKRVSRNVAFIGIQRVVPHSERSQSKSYSKFFIGTPQKGWEQKVMQIAGNILGRSYDEFRYLEHSKYSLPLVKRNGATYSGFNMGAGENSLFEIFSTIYSAGKGALIVIDELELGLHVGAQRKLMEHLKNACSENSTQIICTTHSKEIFDCIPPDARFLIESINEKTKVTNEVASEFAFSKLGGSPDHLDIFVEDDVAQAMIAAALPTELRTQCSVRIIGSAAALSRQLAANYLRDKKRSLLAVFDGDQRSKEVDNIRHGKAMAENPGEDFEAWFQHKITYLPGEAWPELWLLQKCNDCKDRLADTFGVDEDTLTEIFEYSVQAGKHRELYEFAINVNMKRSDCLLLISNVVVAQNKNLFERIVNLVKSNLDA